MGLANWCYGSVVDRRLSGNGDGLVPGSEIGRIGKRLVSALASWLDRDGVIMPSVISGLECERVLDRVAWAVRSVLGSGRVPDQIPALAGADPHAFGLAVATVEGEVHGVGEWRRRFSTRLPP